MGAEEKKGKIGLIIAAVICVLSLIVMTAVLLFYDRSAGSAQKAAFTPPAFDAEAAAGTPEVPEDLGWSEVDAQVFKASVCSVVRVKEDRADIWLTNPESNSVWLKLRLTDSSGHMLGETGLIRPGEYVRSIKLNAEIEGGEPIAMKLMAYEPDTYYSAGSVTLNTTIEEGEVQ